MLEIDAYVEEAYRRKRAPRAPHTTSRWTLEESLQPSQPARWRALACTACAPCRAARSDRAASLQHARGRGALARIGCAPVEKLARREPPALPTCSLESTCLHSMRTVSSSSLGPRCKPATCSWERSTCSHRMRSCRGARSARCHLAAAAALGRGLVAAAILQQIMHTFSSRPQRTGLHVVLHLPRKWIRVAQGDERASQLSTVAARPIANFVARANCLRLLSK